MALPPAAQRVIDAFTLRGVVITVVESAETTRTAAEAAAALQTSVGQIVKSLVFLVDRTPWLALVSGDNRLDEAKLARAVGGTAVLRANADQVRDLTGFAIGGVPPISLNPKLRVVCDAELLSYPIVYAAAGTPHHNFGIAPVKLVEVAAATICDLRQDAPGAAFE
jgi:prolyl-tRNA editing enzyme YbaK/EbsC (Cys-tRNA(Pro) deacylase)